jgi:uncharacterized protein
MQSVPEPAAAEAPCWIVTDGAAGNVRQATALAAAMRVRTIEIVLALRAPWSWLAPRLTRGLRLAVRGEGRRHLTPPWPAMVIGCGRRAAVLGRHVREVSAGRTFAMQILDPRIDPAHFDLVVAPRHDALTGANVIQTLGALNPVDDEWLAAGVAEFPTLRQLPQPRTALLIGGPRQGLEMTDAWFDDMLARTAALVARDHGSLMITCSRRTPQHWRARLHGLLRDGCTHIWTGARDGVNPYQGYLGAADRLVVTPDSVNMLSEACATGKLVLTLLPAGVRGRIAALHTELRDQGWLHTLDAELDGSSLRPPPPLRELAATASKIWHVLESTRPEVAVALGSA